jgi:hypothetical protein
MKKIKLVTIIILSFFTNLLCQNTQGYVHSSVNEPLMYVYVHGNKGNELALTDEKGYFSLNFKESDSLTFSMIGFVDTVIAKKKLLSDINKIHLRQADYLLRELTVKPLSKKYKKDTEWTKEDYGKNINGTWGDIYGGKIAYKITNPRKRLGTIEDIVIDIAKCKYNTFVRLRIYKIKDGFPSDDILIGNRIIYIKKGDSKIKINLSKDLLLCPVEGCFIGLDFVNDNGQTSKLKTVVEPRLTYVQIEQIGLNSFSSHNGGKWGNHPFYYPNNRFDFKVKIAYYED